MSRSVRWGILGNALIARTCVIPAIQKSRNGIVHAIGTRSIKKTTAVAELHAIEHVYESYEAVLEDEAVDAVYIPLPNHLHHSWTLKALAAGKHVLCEKPFCCNAQEAREMAQAAAKAGLLLMEAFMYRFHPRTARIKQLVSDGVIGTLRMVRSSFCYHMEDAVLKNYSDPRLNPEMGGGALLDVGCYSISIARWLFGAEPTEAWAQAVYNGSGVDVHFAGSLLFPGGGLGSIEASFITALQQTYTALGNNGAIELPHDAFIPWENDAVFTVRGRHEEVGEAHIIPGIDEYRLMVEHFADAALDNSTLAWLPEDSIANMRVLDALAESARTRKPVSL